MLDLLEVGLGKPGEGRVELKDFWLLEFWAAEPMIRKGAEAAREALPAIQEKLEARRKASVPTEI